MEYDIIGMIVTSRAGRDKGRAFVVVGRAGDEQVLLVDGKLRLAAKPKRKKLKHIHVTNDRVEIAQELMRAGTADAFIRAKLRELGYDSSSNIKEG